MSTITYRWPSTGLVPFDLSAMLPRMSSPIRVEERVEGEMYVLRAELPGVNPAQDIKIVYRDGALRLQIQRMDERKDKTHTEFHYGSYGRTIALPEGTDEHSIRATYSDGILEIRAMMADPRLAHRPIPIAIVEGERREVRPTMTRPIEARVPEATPADVKMVEPEMVEPEMVEPKMVEPKMVEPKPRAAKSGPGRRTGNGVKH